MEVSRLSRALRYDSQAVRLTMAPDSIQRLLIFHFHTEKFLTAIKFIESIEIQ